MTTTYFLNCVAGNVYRTKTSPALPTNYYVGLSSTAPNLNGTGATEPSANAGYARPRLAALSQPNNGVVSNTAEINFAESTGDWGTMTYFLIYDSPTVGSGNLLMYGLLTKPRRVEADTIMTIKTGDMKLTLQNPA